MKTIVKIALLTILLLMILGINGAKAHDDYTRVIKKEYTLTPDAQLIINNKFGDVHCNNWDKNAVGFEITITVSASDQKEAEQMLDRIDIIFNISPGLVEAKTRIGDGKGNNKGQFSIDYAVSMPMSVNLDVTNKFGDIFVNETAGKTKINLGYGNLEVNKLSNGDNLLDIKFGKANVKWMKGAVLMLKYSDMNLDYAGSLRLDSKFSNLDAEKIIALNVNFEGGKLNMENSSAVDSKSKFSDLEIGRIEQSLNLDIQYGNCDVREMPADFTNISIQNKFANVSIGLPDQARYTLDADLRFCDLDFPEEKAKFSFRSKSSMEKVFKGVIGNEELPKSRVFVHSEYGNVSLK